MPQYRSSKRATSLTRWAVNNFKAWKAAWKVAQEERCLNNLLQLMDPHLLCVASCSASMG